VADDIMMLQEVRNDVREVKRLLTGNGGIGICETVRENTKNIAEVIQAIEEISKTVGKVTVEASAHMSWHNAPENQTIQSLAKNAGVRFSVLVVLILLALFAGVMGVSGAIEVIKGLVT